MFRIVDRQETEQERGRWPEKKEEEEEEKRKNAERPDIVYRYVVNVRALETFTNLMQREGIRIPDRKPSISLWSPRLLDMKALKEKGLLWSYKIIRVRTKEEVLEEG